MNDKEIFLFVSKIGEEQSSEDAEDGPPELLVYSALFVAIAVASNMWTKACALVKSFEVFFIYYRMLLEATCSQQKKLTKWLVKNFLKLIFRIFVWLWISSCDVTLMDFRPSWMPFCFPLLVSVHSWRPHSQNFRLLLESKWTLGTLQCLWGQYYASVADGKH